MDEYIEKHLIGILNAATEVESKEISSADRRAFSLQPS